MNWVVTVETPSFFTPRIDMQVCSASIITATPRVLSAPSIALDDLRRQRLLGLQPARENVDDARKLRQADDAVARVIGDVRLADERRDVVLAMRDEGNVADEDQVLVAVDVVEDPRQMLAGVLAVAGEQFLVGLDHPARGVEQPLAIGIVAGPGDQGADRRLGLVASRARRRFGAALVASGFGAALVAS